MSPCRWLRCILVLAGVAAFASQELPAFAQEKQGDGPKFVWKAFDPGTKEFFQTLTTHTTQKMKVSGMEVTQDQNQTFYIKWVPQKKDAKGNWVVKQKIVGVKMDIDIGGHKIAYDSTDAEQPQNPMTDFFTALLGLDLTFTVSPKEMKVESIAGNEEFIKTLAKTNPQMEPLLQSILSKDALTKMAEPTLFAFPTVAVQYDEKNKKGTRWERKSTLRLGPIGSYETRYEFEYKGKDEDLDRIEVTASMTYAPPAASDRGKLPFVVERGELTGKGGRGTALFNAKLGRFDKYEMKMKLSGALEVDVGGMKTTVDLDQDQTATVITSDTNPVAEKTKKD